VVYYLQIIFAYRSSPALTLSSLFFAIGQSLFFRQVGCFDDQNKIDGIFMGGTAGKIIRVKTNVVYGFISPHSRVLTLYRLPVE